MFSETSYMEWSIALHESALLIKYWSISIKGIRNKLSVEVQLQTIRELLPLAISTELLEYGGNPFTALRHERKRKRMLMFQHRELRTAQRTASIQKESEIRGVSTVKIAQAIARIEETRKVFNALRVVYNPIDRAGLTNIDIPDKVNAKGEVLTWQRITDPTDVENRLITRNEMHFGRDSLYC
jgi:hypothetical protein